MSREIRNKNIPAPHPYEIETIFIARFPEDIASKIREKIDSNELSDDLYLDIDVDYNRGKVKYHDEVLNAKLCNLPCIIECLKTLDRKTYYKSGDISQILICQKEPFPELSNDSLLYRRTNKKERDKKFLYNHGLTPPLKNVRKRRFRKIIKKKTLDLAQIEKEVRRLLQADNEAEKVSWELLYDDNTKILREEEKPVESNVLKQSAEKVPTASPSGSAPIERGHETAAKSDGQDAEVFDNESNAAAALGSANSTAMGETDLFGESLSSSPSGSERGSPSPKSATSEDDLLSEDFDFEEKEVGVAFEERTDILSKAFDETNVTIGDDALNDDVRLDKTTLKDDEAVERNLKSDQHLDPELVLLYERLKEIGQKKQTYLSELDNLENPALRLRFEKMLSDLSVEESEIKEKLNLGQG